MAGVPQKTLNWLYDVLKREYHDPNRTYSDLAQTLAQYPGLAPRTDVYTSDNGVPALLFNLKGTLPVNFRGTVYRFPIALWVPHAYPYEAPIIYVVPTEDMVVRPGQHVSTSDGKVYHPYLARWNETWDKSNTVEFLNILADVFSREPPVMAKPPSVPTVHQQPQPQRQSGPPPVPPPPHQQHDQRRYSNQPAPQPGSSSRNGTPVPGGPPPPPPKHSTDPSRPGSAGPPSLAPKPGRYDAPLPLPQQTQRPQPQLPPQQPYRNGSTQQSQFGGQYMPQRTSSLRQEYPQQQPSLPQQYGSQSPGQPPADQRPTTVQSHNSPGQMSSPPPPPHSSYQQYQHMNPPVRPLSPPSLAQLPQPIESRVKSQPSAWAQPTLPQQQSQPQPQSPQQYQRPQQPQYHHPHPQSNSIPLPPQHQPMNQPPPQPKPAQPKDLLSEDDPFQISLSTTSRSNLPAPPIPTNPEKTALLSHLSHQILSHLHTSIQQTHSNALPSLQSQHAALITASQTLSSELHQLQTLSSQLQSNISALQSTINNANSTIQSTQDPKHASHPDNIPAIDQIIIPPTVVARQLYDAVAEQRGYEAAIFALNEAFVRGRIGAEVWGRKVRECAREEMRRKWLVRKIGNGLGLEDH